MSSNALYHERKAAGICPNCKEPVSAGSVYCDKCKAYYRKYYKHFRQANRAAGLCRCGAELDGVHKMCRFCRTKQIDANNRYLAKKKERAEACTTIL